jgi:hypothetical protein
VKALLPKTIWSLMGFWIFMAAICLGSYICAGQGHVRELTIIGLMCLTVSASQFFVCLLGEGEWDLDRHLFLSGIATDACFIFSILWIVGATRYLGTLIVKKPMHNPTGSVVTVEG